MTDETEIPEGEEVEWEVDEAPEFFPDTLGAGMAFFYPDLGQFCEDHSAKCVLVAEDGGVWLFPKEGGKAVSLESYGKPRGGLHAVKPDGRPN